MYAFVVCYLGVGDGLSVLHEWGVTVVIVSHRNWPAAKDATPATIPGKIESEHWADADAGRVNMWSFQKDLVKRLFTTVTQNDAERVRD